MNRHEDPHTSAAAGRHDRFRSGTARTALGVLALAALYQGLWAQLAPRSFYRDFPAGLGWLAGEGAYNEHFVRDIGGLADGLGVVALVAAWTLSRPLLIANAAGWSAYALPHLVFHLAHPLPSGESQTVNVLVLVSEVLLPLVGLLGTARRRGPRAVPGSRPRRTYATRAW